MNKEMRSCIFLTLLTIAVAAPNRNVRSLTAPPLWHLPCGEVIEQDSYEDSQQDLGSILSDLSLQHQIMLQDYLNRDYEYLYDRVRIGVHEHQYIPNWVPGKKDSNHIRKLSKSSQQTVSKNVIVYIIILKRFVNLRNYILSFLHWKNSTERIDRRRAPSYIQIIRFLRISF